MQYMWPEFAANNATLNGSMCDVRAIDLMGMQRGQQNASLDSIQAAIIYSSMSSVTRFVIHATSWQLAGMLWAATIDSNFVVKSVELSSASSCPSIRPHFIM